MPVLWQTFGLICQKMLYYVYMDPQNRQSLKEYEMKRFYKMIDRFRTLYVRTRNDNIVKQYLFKRRILKETIQHFSILNRLYNHDSKKDNRK